MQRRACAATIALCWALGTSPAWAGMPTPLPIDVLQYWRLTESTHARWQAASFFLFVLLASAAVVHWLWNRTAREVPRLPRLTFGKSLVLVGIWGLLSLVVLTMIAGTRELMTPGVWAKEGLLYRIADAPAAAPDEQYLPLRRARLLQLRAALWHYAARHEGRFPDSVASSGISEQLRELPGMIGVEYLYVPGRTMDNTSAIIVYEPSVFGDVRLALRASGELATLAARELRSELEGERP